MFILVYNYILRKGPNFTDENLRMFGFIHLIGPEEYRCHVLCVDPSAIELSQSLQEACVVSTSIMRQFGETWGNTTPYRLFQPVLTINHSFLRSRMLNIDIFDLL